MTLIEFFCSLKTSFDLRKEKKTISVMFSSTTRECSLKHKIKYSSKSTRNFLRIFILASLFSSCGKRVCLGQKSAKVNKKVLFYFFQLHVENIFQNSNEPKLAIILLDGFRHDYLDRGVTPNMKSLMDYVRISPPKI